MGRLQARMAGLAGLSVYLPTRESVCTPPARAQALPLPAQCLFLRLSQRKGPCFRLGSLAYKEVPDAAAAAAQLASAGLAVLLGGSGAGAAASPAASPGSPAAGAGAGNSADWRQLADLLTVPDLAAMLSARRFQLTNGAAVAGAAPRSRPQLLEALERHAARSAAAERELNAWLLAAAGPVLLLADGACEAVGRLQRLFFLSEGQSLSQVRLLVTLLARLAAATAAALLVQPVQARLPPTSLLRTPTSPRRPQFLATDMGALQYPQYTVHRTCPVFAGRAELLAYEEALGHAAQLADALEVSSVLLLGGARAGCLGGGMHGRQSHSGRLSWRN